MRHIIVNPGRSLGTINPNIYGHFSEHLGRCIYDGLFVGKDSDIENENGMRKAAVASLRDKARIPVLRWPGGCFADTYHWMDGIGPAENRKTIVNTHWGGVTEDNSFGTHEFLELCRQLGCEAYISGNVGSGTVQEFSDWVEYCNMPGTSPMSKLRRENGQDEPFNVTYWGIGNEAWGCGGNMTAEYYADECRKYATYLRNYSDHRIVKIASGANVDDYHWTKVVAEKAGRVIDAVSLHYYTVPGPDWRHKGSALEFSKDEYYHTVKKTLYMDTLVENHSRIMREVCKDKKLGLVVDEWGTWFDVEPGTNPGFLYQQNTIRDAIIAGLNLNIFNNHCDAVIMANIAQTVNVLQALILTEGKISVETPTLKVFELYAGHQGAEQLESYAEAAMVGTEGDEVPDLNVSASRAADGSILVTVVNADADEEKEIAVSLGCAPASVEGKAVFGVVGEYNDFENPDRVVIRPVEARAADFGFTAKMPASSVAAFTVRF